MVQKSFTLHLAKADITQFRDGLTEASRERLGDENVITVNDPEFAEGACLYVLSDEEALQNGSETFVDVLSWIGELKLAQPAQS